MLSIGKIPFWQADGSSLYLNEFIWEGQALRDAFASLLAGQGFNFPLYTFNVGYGADIPTVLGGMLNDPFNLVSAFVPQEHALWAYEALIFVRLFLAAVTFSFYALRKGNSREAAMVGALVYAFCGFMLFWGLLRHPHFMNMGILLPLVARGADNLFEHGRSPLLVAAFALQFLVSFYFAYMTCLLLLVYCVIKYFLCPRQRSFGDFVVLVLRFVVHIAIGFCMAAVSAVPIVMNLASLGRVGSEPYVPMLYEFAYYAVKPTEFIGGLVSKRGSFIGAVGIIGVLVFLFGRPYIQKSTWRAWALGLVLAFVGTLLPFVGHMMNGFSYPTDRWMLGASFIVAYVCVLAVPVLPRLNARQKRWIVAGCVLFCIGVAPSLVGKFRVGVAVMTTFFLIVLAIVLRASSRSSARGLSALLCVLVVLGAAGAATFKLMPSVGGYAEEHVSARDALDRVVNYDPILAVEEAVAADGDPCARAVVSGARKNTGLNSTALSVDFYSSFYNQPIDDFRCELGIADDSSNYLFVGSDSRLALDLLTGTRYYALTDKGSWLLPYTYETTGISRGAYTVYGTEHALPVAFASRTVISRADYEALSMVERQEALLQGSVLSDDDIDKLDIGQVKPATSAQEVPFEVVCSDGIAYEDGCFTVADVQAQATVTFKGLAESETYLVLHDLGFSGARETGKVAATGIKGLLQGIRQFMHDAAWREPVNSSVHLQVDGNGKVFEVGTPRDVGFAGKDDWASCLGYSADGLASFNISFAELGSYTFDDMQIVCQPVKPVVKQADTLAKGAAHDLSLQDGHISASFDVAAGDTLAFFSVAYSPGWSATVDGQPAEVMKADTGFMAVPLSGAGSHHVELRYLTPGLAQGAILSVLGLVAFIILIVRSRRVR